MHSPIAARRGGHAVTEKTTIYQKVTDHILEAMAANPEAEWVMPWHVPTC